MLAQCGRLEASHDAQPEVDQIVLAAAELMLDERSGMDAAVAVSATLNLEHLGSEHAAREMADASGAETENGQDFLQLAMQQRQRLEIRHRLPDFRRPCRLRDFLEQGETVAVLVLGGAEEAVQQGAGIIGQMSVHEGDQLFLALMQPRTDRFDQGSGSGNLEALLNKKIDTAVENQPRFQVRPRHRGNLGRKDGFGFRAERGESVMVKDEPLMPLSGAVRIHDREGGIHAKAAGRDGKIAGREVCGREEPSCCAKVTAARRKADPMIRVAHVPRDARQGFRELEKPLAFSMVELGRPVEGLLLAGRENAHSGHERQILEQAVRKRGRGSGWENLEESRRE